jgi:hypothetical protein
MGNLLSSAAVQIDGWKSDARYAMESGAYCVVCGAPFDTEGDVYNLDAKAPQHQVSHWNSKINFEADIHGCQWLFNFRLLGVCEDLNNHRLTSGTSECVYSTSLSLL